MMTYDYIVTGLGCAGMSFMYYLLDTPLQHKKILIIDSSSKVENDRTWCYWANEPLEIHPKNTPLIFWENINIIDSSRKLSKPLGNLKYFHIKSSDFYKEVIRKIRKFPNVDFVCDRVTGISNYKDELVGISTENNGEYFSQKIFNSIPFEFSGFKGPLLKQTFVGWRVRCNDQCFDNTTATLMHFPSNSSSGAEFFYVLPFNPSEALVEYTVYTTESCEVSQMEDKIRSYLSEELKIDDYNILFREIGTIPMTTFSFKNKNNPNVIPIGTLAGCTKPSTGYTFYDIQKHSKLIVEQLLEGHTQKSLTWKRKKRFRFYDNIILNIAKKWPSELPSIFKEMFEKNNANLILKFLNEETGLFEELKLLGRLRYWIFFKSLLNYEKH